MGKDYAASHKAHQAYQEEIERIQCSYNHAWAKLQDERDEARKKAWEIRKTALAEAETPLK